MAERHLASDPPTTGQVAGATVDIDAATHLSRLLMHQVLDAGPTCCS